MRVLIIGQGIAGTWLSYALYKAGAEVIVIDEYMPGSSTRVASGVINPVTGRQVATTWMAETLLPFAEREYAAIGNFIGQTVIQPCGITAFPPSEQMLKAYEKKMEEGSPYVHPLKQLQDYESYFRFVFGGVYISPAYWVDLQVLLSGWQSFLKEKALLVEDSFSEDSLMVSEGGVSYKGIQADYVFYCQGIQIATSPYWSGLPFSFNKGEALLADIPGLPHGQIYKFGISTLVPWHNDQWWVGSTYDNRFEDDQPTSAFRKRMELFLEQTLKIPFTISGQMAAIRPATVERRPFAGIHPHNPRVGILGGLGTKGVSLAPWIANELVGKLMHGKPMEPEIDIARFRRAFQLS